MPASPRSPRSATGRAGEPLERLLAAAETAGYAVERRQAASAHGGVNPTRVDLRLGPHFTKLLVYSWFITVEGHGRGKDDYRIQTTRAHEGPLISEKSRLSVGVGWLYGEDVFVAFDAWAKRYTGGSSSVHIRRALTDVVRQQGVGTDGSRYDPRFGFDAANVEGFVRWAHALGTQKVAVIAPHDWTRISDNEAIIVGKVHASQPTSWVRVRDELIVIDTNKRIADDSLWQIRTITTQDERTAAGYPRRFLRFDCRRVGTIDRRRRETIADLL